MRAQGRAAGELRATRIETGVNLHAEGSALIHSGNTQVLCTASVEERVPPHRRGTGRGWVTAEYAMLPRATTERGQRDSVAGRIGGRSHEIQRLIGRSLRSAVDMEALGERSVILDCDVLQADGGTRTAAITGAFVALYLAARRLKSDGAIGRFPIRFHVAAVSAGIIAGEARLDLDYSEDHIADTDLNCVMTEAGQLVELQATAEVEPFTATQLAAMMGLVTRGISQLIILQKRTLNAAG